MTHTASSFCDPLTKKKRFSKSIFLINDNICIMINNKVMWDNVCFLNRPYPSSLVPLFQSESKCETILMKMTLICMKMELLAEFIFIWKVSHLDSFWNRGAIEIGNGLLNWAYGRIDWSGYKSRMERIAHPRLETEPSPGGGHCFVFQGKTSSLHLFPPRCIIGYWQMK